MVNILIVDDYPIVRDGIRACLSFRREWTICGETDNPTETIALAHQFHPEIAIVDLSLKQGDGLVLIRQLTALPWAPRVLVFSMHDEALYAHRALQAGALGYLHKQNPAEQLVTAIERLLEGKLVLSDDALYRMVHRATDRRAMEEIRSPIDKLTDRELAVFEGIGRGLTVQQIADSLQLSVKTVQTYRDRAKKKLRLRTAADLLRYAVQWMIKPEGG